MTHDPAVKLSEQALERIRILLDGRTGPWDQRTVEMLLQAYDEKCAEVGTLADALRAIERGEDEDPALVASNALEELYGLDQQKEPGGTLGRRLLDSEAERRRV